MPDISKYLELLFYARLKLLPTEDSLCTHVQAEAAPFVWSFFKGNSVVDFGTERVSLYELKLPSAAQEAPARHPSQPFRLERTADHATQADREAADELRQQIDASYSQLQRYIDSLK